jgi:threonine 3-dehydrogenase
MAKLITGGMGYVGSETARQLVNRGEELVIFDIAVNSIRIEDFKHKVKIVQGDLGNFSEVLNVVKDNKISEIYHLGGALTWISELDPWASFSSNVIGTYNILEAARLLDVRKVMFASAMATFGLGVKGVISDITIQRPMNMYGCGKLYGEGLGRWYSRKFGLDFRSVRYASMIGPNVRTPGHWGPSMIEDAIVGKPNDCVYAKPETAISMIYFTDAAKAAIDILDAPKEKIRMINYNVAGIPKFITASEIEKILKKRYPAAMVNYNTDPSSFVGYPADTIFDDSYARKEWGWSPVYTTPEAIIEQFENNIKEHPKRYGLA